MFFFLILAPPKIIDVVIESNNNEILKENEQVILKCLTRGIPHPKIIWQLPGKFQLNKRNDGSKYLMKKNSKTINFPTKISIY